MDKHFRGSVSAELCFAFVKIKEKSPTAPVLGLHAVWRIGEHHAEL